MTAPRFFNKTTIFVSVLALFAWLQIFAVVIFTSLNLQHDVPLSIVLFRHSNLNPLLLLVAAALLFKRNGIAIVFVLAALTLPFCDSLFSYGHRLDWQLVLDVAIHGFFVWYCLGMIRRGEITAPRESFLKPRYLSVLLFVPIFQAFYIAYFLFLPGPTGRSFVSMAEALPIFWWHVAFILVASTLLILGVFFLRSGKRTASWMLAAAALLALGAEIIYYSYPALVTVFLAITFWTFGNLRDKKILPGASGDSQVQSANLESDQSASNIVGKNQAEIPGKLIPVLLSMPTIVLGILAYQHRVYGVPFATSEIPWAIIIGSGLSLAALQTVLSIVIYKEIKSRVKAVSIGLLVSIISMFAFIPGTIGFIDARMNRQVIKETVLLESLEAISKGGRSYRYYLLLSGSPAQLKTGIQGTSPSLEVCHNQFEYLKMFGAAHGSNLEILEALGGLGLPYVISAEISTSPRPPH